MWDGGLRLVREGTVKREWRLRRMEVLELVAGEEARSCEAGKSA
jgi:hypothetical protein